MVVAPRMQETGWGRIVLAGVVICLLGIYICGKAGMMKEKEMPKKVKSIRKPLKLNIMHF
ncbi:MAG: hypothetical protein AAB212_08880 [Bacteroidota bacterium]